MSGVAAAAPAPVRARHRLASSAQLYIFAVATTAAAVSLPSLLTLDAGSADLVAFLLLAAGAVAASFFVVPTGHNHGFHLAIVFSVAAATLLPPGLVVLVPIAQHVPDIVRRSLPWYIQTFNVANYLLNAFAAWTVVHAVGVLAPGSAQFRFALAGSAASLVYVLLNHFLLATALRLARGHSFRESGLFAGHGLWIDMGLAGLGVALAAFWHSNPYLVPALLAPLVLVQRSFSVLGQLRGSEARFRAMFESAAVGSWLVDLEGRVLSSNRSYEETLGYTKEELVGTTQESVTHPDDRERDAELFREMVAGGRESYQLEKRFLRKDGDYGWGQLTSSLVRDADGKPQFAIGILQDVTRSKQLEEELRHAQKMEAVGRLAGGVAHDFNNLLTVIQNYSAFALERLTGDREALRGDLVEIQKAGQRAAALTRQLLAFSRRQVVHPQVLNLNTVVSDTYNMVSRLIGNDVRVVTTLEPELGHLKADPDQLAQVLVNLAVNARDAMPSGGTLTVETRNAELADRQVHGGVELLPGRYVALVVRDTGTGMDADTVSRIFEPFFTTKEKGKGTGLGLSTVYGIVTGSGGAISVASETGQGTTFTVLFPQVDEPVAVSEQTGAGERAEGGGETVLVVEDEDAVRGAIRRMLRARGYDVLEAFDPVEALQIAERHRGPIHVLVTDVVMPLMRGPDLVEQLRPLRPEMKVLFVSGYADEEDPSRLVAGDGVAFLAKPFTEDALTENVSALLAGDAPVLAQAAA